MQLKDFLTPYPHVSVAGPEDNQEILNFYHQSALSSSKSQIKYYRGDDFFAFLKERSKKFLVLVLKDDVGEIQGMGVLSYREGYIGGKLQTIGYLGDLRVKLNKLLIREWRSMYAALMGASPFLEETFFCRHYQTVLIDENNESRNNLAATKIPNLVYNRLLGYKMVNVIGRIRTYSLKHDIRFGRVEDHDEIMHFLRENASRDFFAHNWEKEFQHRLESWNSFDLSSFLLAHEDGKLVGVSMLWNPIKTKQITIDQIPLFVKLLHRFGKLLPFLEFKNLPIIKIPLNILYMNQVIFHKDLKAKSKKEITQDFLHFSFNKDFHMLAYADFENENYLDGMSCLFMQKMSMALYSVHHKNDLGEISDPITWSKDSVTPTFDMALV